MIACAKIICFAEGRVSFGRTARPSPAPRLLTRQIEGPEGDDGRWQL